MYQEKENHTIDLVFVLSLFAVFTISALILILLCSRSYQSIVDKMDGNYETRISYAYITEKIRSLNTADAISVGEFGDGYALYLKEDISGQTYHTVIYSYEGSLRELFCREDANLQPSAGQEIMDLDELSFNRMEGDVIHITLTDRKNETYSLYVHTLTQE